VTRRYFGEDHFYEFSFTGGMGEGK
jgi:hypothetical protein